MQAGKISLADVGLTEMPKAGEKLSRPFIEFTTKLEEIDRFITHDEARELAKLDLKQFDELKKLTLQVNEVISKHATAVGLTHADSKIELGIDDSGKIIVVDTVGTPDENRFLLNEFHVTKQILRDYYLVRGLEKDVQKWAAENKPRSTWPRPEPLPAEFIDLASQLYKSICNRWAGTTGFSVPILEEIVIRAKELQTKWIYEREGELVS